MEFRLIYEGPLRANGSVAHKHEIRKVFHPQLKELWQHRPLAGFNDWVTHGATGPSLLRSVAGFWFAPLVCNELAVVAELDVVMLRASSRGAVIHSGGDMDNQLKTLFDALRCPNASQEIPSGETPSPTETPFFCLLDDDEKIVKVTVTADRYLAAPDPKQVHVSILVKTRVLFGTVSNLSLG